MAEVKKATPTFVYSKKKFFRLTGRWIWIEYFSFFLNLLSVTATHFAQLLSVLDLSFISLLSVTNTNVAQSRIVF